MLRATVRVAELPEWISLDDAVALALGGGAAVQEFNEILAGGFKRYCIGIVALLELALIERVRVNFPARAAELNAMRTWLVPQHVEEFLARATRVECLPGNRLRVMVFWGINVDRVLVSDTCTLGGVRVHRPSVASELEAAGFGKATSPKGTEQPRTVKPDLRTAILKGLEALGTPGTDVPWGKFCTYVRCECKVNETTRGYGDRSIQRSIKIIGT
jgi:hypothetical protein